MKKETMCAYKLNIKNDIMSSVDELSGLYALCGRAQWLWSDLVDRLCDLPGGA